MAQWERLDRAHAAHLERPALIVVDVARGRRRAHLEQVAVIVGRVILLVVAARHGLRVVAGRDALYRHRHLGDGMRREVTRRAVLPAGDRHIALARDLHARGGVVLHAAAGLEKRPLGHQPRADDVHHAVREGRLPPVESRAREDIAVEVVAREVLRVEQRLRLLDLLVRPLHAQGHRRQQVVGREADGLLVAVRHLRQQLGQDLTRCRHTLSPPLSPLCAGAR